MRLRFIQHTDGFIEDSLTGLLWAPETIDVVLSQSVKVADALSYDGLIFRLPTIEEMRTIIDTEQAGDYAYWSCERVVHKEEHSDHYAWAISKGPDIYTRAIQMPGVCRPVCRLRGSRP